MINTHLINSGLMDDKFTGINESTLTQIMEKYNLTITTKTNTVDVACAVQHNTSVLEAYLKNFDNVVYRMNKIDPTKYLWKR